MRSLLCWCICWWVVGSPAVVAGGWWSVAGEEKMVSSRCQKTVAPGAIDSHLPATNHLPCQDSSPACLQTLGDLAVQHSREITVMEQAIQLQKKKLWTSWLNADGLNPLAIGLRIARNLAGGGDRAAAKLELARRTAQRAELETNLRHSVVQAVLEYERAQQQLHAAQTSLATHAMQLRFAEISYRLGEGSTETMLQNWQRYEELQSQNVAAALQVKRAFTVLDKLLH
jgi:Outer membrane efflux protein